MKWLKRHPFPVVAKLEQVVALSFAFPESVLRPMVPDGLEIDTFGNYGFVTVSLVRTRKLRPAVFPECLGQDFFLAGYRIFTRLRDDSGRRLRGLKILGSETDKRRMVWLGNLMTGYRYRQVKWVSITQGTETHLRTMDRNDRLTLDIAYDDPKADIPLPSASPFPDQRTARRFAGPMPFTFSPDGERRFVVIEGNRTDWTPRPVEVKHWQVALFDTPPFEDAQPILANAFAVDDIPYRWSKGRLVHAGGDA